MYFLKHCFACVAAARGVAREGTELNSERTGKRVSMLMERFDSGGFSVTFSRSFVIEPSLEVRGRYFKPRVSHSGVRRRALRSFIRVLCIWTKNTSKSICNFETENVNLTSEESSNNY